jgi:hypothetical protein
MAHVQYQPPRGGTRRLVRAVVPLLGACLIFPGGGAQADPPLYRVTSLGELSGDPNGGYSEAYALNDLGQVVGQTQVDLGDETYVLRAFLWLPTPAYGLAQGMHDLGVIPPDQDPWITDSLARDINEAGQLTGESGGWGFVWFPESFHSFPVKTPWPLPEFDDLTPNHAWALDDGVPPNGDPVRVVGWGQDQGSPLNFGFFWESNKPTQLERVNPPAGEPYNWTNSQIYGIRPDGSLRRVLAGKAHYGPLIGYYGAIGFDKFAGDAALTLHLPEGFVTTEGPYAEARDASNWGELVGWGKDERFNFLRRALYWETVLTNDPVDLHSAVDIPGPQETLAEAIARPGDLPHVVGWNVSSAEALLWKRDSQGQWSVEDLNELIGTRAQIDWDLREAYDINNGTSIPGWGQFPTPWIVGWGLYGTYPSDKHRAFLLSTAKECPEDLDFDGDIDTADLLILLGNWGYCLEGEICWADIDMDGDVDTADLLDLLGHWGECGIGGGHIPRNVQDCIDRFGFDPVALEACIQAVRGELE